MKIAQLARIVQMFKGRDVGFFAALAGAICFVLSLLLVLLLCNLAFFLIWLAAAGATAAYMRIHRQWRAMFERIYGMQSVQTVLAARKNWRRNVEDVVFRELPDEPVPFGK